MIIAYKYRVITYNFSWKNNIHTLPALEWEICNEPLSKKHVFMHCQKYQADREALNLSKKLKLL